jgi:transcriptional regulator with XRE-family HTH domain
MPPVNVSSIGAYIRQQREQARISMRQLASAAGISNPYLSQVERGLRRPSAEILQQIAKGLRISAEALYVQAGILDQRPSTEARAAILADPELAERQKQVLLDIYESFRREAAVARGPAPVTAAGEASEAGAGEAAAGEAAANGTADSAAGGKPKSRGAAKSSAAKGGAGKKRPAPAEPVTASEAGV